MTLTRKMTTPKVHVLDFYTDSDAGSALTVLVNGVRFHIIVDAQDLKSKSLHDQYARLVAATKGEDEACVPKTKNKDEKDENAEEKSWCTCQKPEDGRGMIACENEDCRYEWFHFSCVGLDRAPEGQWICPDCRDSSPASDSGVDVSTPEEKLGATDVHVEGEAEEPDQKLQNWIISPFGAIFEPLTPAHETSTEQKTLAEWYDPKTSFYSLKSNGSELEAVQLEETDELVQRMKDLTPRLAMPKYITDLDLPHYDASDIIVMEESDTLGPLRPSRVRIGDEEYFLKMVDPSQPGPTKREIKILKQIERKGLHKQFRVPQVLGLVSQGECKKEIMGFLQTDIPSPTPLTHLVDSDISQRRRNKWAAESKRIVDLLHEHDLIFGDCKADNFLVDSNDELWIIDFGGSYTDGWVDPDLAETEEGDDMAVEKIVNALHDPEANTIDLEDEQEHQRKEKEDGKRKRSSEESSDGTEEGLREHTIKSRRVS